MSTSYMDGVQNRIRVRFKVLLMEHELKIRPNYSDLDSWISWIYHFYFVKERKRERERERERERDENEARKFKEMIHL